MPNLHLPPPSGTNSSYPKDPAPSKENTTSGALASAIPNAAKGGKKKHDFPRNNYQRTMLLGSLAVCAQQAAAMPKNDTALELCPNLSPALESCFALPTCPATPTEASDDFEKFLRTRTTADTKSRQSLGDTNAVESGKPVREATKTSIAMAKGAYVEDGGGIFYRVSLGDNPAANMKHLLHIPSFATQFVGGDPEIDSPFLSEIRNRYVQSSDSHAGDVVYVKGLKEIHKEIGKAKTGYAPLGFADTLTVQAIAPDASVYIFTSGDGFYIDIPRFLKIFSTSYLPFVSGTAFNEGQYETYDFGHAGDRNFLGLAMLRALVGHLVYSNTTHHEMFPEFYLTTADLSENGDVTFGPLSEHDPKPKTGLAMWLKDGDQTKVFIWKQIFIEALRNSESTKNAIAGVRNLVAKVSEDEGTVMLAKAINFDLLKSKPNWTPERNDLARELLTLPEEKVRAVVCDRHTEATLTLPAERVMTVVHDRDTAVTLTAPAELVTAVASDRHTEMSLPLRGEPVNTGVSDRHTEVKDKGTETIIISPPLFVQGLDEVVEWPVPGGFGHGDDEAAFIYRRNSGSEASSV